MKYKYSLVVPPKEHLKWIERPMIQVEIFGANNSMAFGALIDSGADCSLFNIQIAEILGIDLSKSKSTSFLGISGGIKGYRVEKVKIKVENIEKSIEIPICFVDSPSVGLLLGQEGFFDQHRIKFEKDHDTFEVTPVKK